MRTFSPEFPYFWNSPFPDVLTSVKFRIIYIRYTSIIATLFCKSWNLFHKYVKICFPEMTILRGERVSLDDGSILSGMAVILHMYGHVR